MLFLIISFVTNLTFSYGYSTFPRTVYDDIEEFDWIVTGNDLDLFFKNNPSYLKDVSAGGAFLDIKQVTYLMNRNFLNATILLNADMKKIQNSPEANFGILVDADMNKNTGKDGWDYAVKSSIANNSQKMQLFEILPDGTWKERQTYFNSKPINSEDKSIDVYLILKDINSPTRFRIAFFSSTLVFVKGMPFHIGDLSDWIVIPPYSINLFSDHNEIEMPAGETKMVQWTMNSSSKLQGYYRMFLNDDPLFTKELIPFGTIQTCIMDTSSYKQFEKPIVQFGFGNLNDNNSNYTGRGFPFSFNQQVTVSSNNVSGINVNFPSGLVDFNAYDSYYKLLYIHSKPNATQGLNFLTIKARLVDLLSILNPITQLSNSSVFGNSTLYGCTPRYARESGVEANMDIKVNILPPKTIIDVVNDYLQKNSALVTIITAIIVGLLSSLLPPLGKKLQRKRHK